MSTARSALHQKTFGRLIDQQLCNNAFTDANHIVCNDYRPFKVGFRTEQSVSSNCGAWLKCRSFLRHASPRVSILHRILLCERIRVVASTGERYDAFNMFHAPFPFFVQAGARVMGIPHDLYDRNVTELDMILKSANGVLFTGGGLSLAPSSTFYRTGSYIFKQVQAINAAGVHLPLHGTCMGFQFLSILGAGGNSSVLQSGFDSESLSIPLDFTAKAAESRLFGHAPAEVMRILRTENVTANLHHSGVTPETFATNTKLVSFFNVLSTNVDRVGRSFVSTIEARDFPIRGTQWHPERPQFEWSPVLNLNHSTDAMTAMQFMANFFVGEARRNTQSFFSSAGTQDLLQRYITYNMTRIPMSEDPFSGYFAVLYS